MLPITNPMELRRFSRNSQSAQLTEDIHTRQFITLQDLKVLFFDPEYGSDIFLRNVGWLSTDYTTL
jgi:hypothetical protein